MESLPYTWKQSLNDVDITVEVPKGTRAKTLTIEIQMNRLKVASPTQTYIDVRHTSYFQKGELHKEAKVQDSTWTLGMQSFDFKEDQQFLLIHIEKQKTPEWWSCVIKGHPEVDTTKLEPENSKLSDLDGETRSMVEKMMFDQQQKALGKPTSDELKKLEMLEKFKQAHPEMDVTILLTFSFPMSKCRKIKLCKIVMLSHKHVCFREIYKTNQE